MAVEIGAEYASSLADLTVNSKPLINMLTILAEENQEHAGVIVNALETHLEKVRPEVKLPVLYLVDSIIKNVGGAYTQKFSQIIVKIFPKVFKQVDEKTRLQMFKLRETWNDVFPANKLYQLDVKVNLVDPAWPIQAQLPVAAPAIHVNPHFHKKGVLPGTSKVASPKASPTVVVDDEEEMRKAVARKQQELLRLQQKKIEIELEQARRQLDEDTKKIMEKRSPSAITPPTSAVHPFVTSTPTALVAPVASVPPTQSLASVTAGKIPVQQRLGPPVSSPHKALTSGAGARIAPVSGAMLAGARRQDPRLARHQSPSHHVTPQPPIASNVFDIKPLDRVTKRKNAITIDVRPDVVDKLAEPRIRDPRRRVLGLERKLDRKRLDDARLRRDNEKPQRTSEKPSRTSPKTVPGALPVVDGKKVKLPPIPKLKKPSSASPTKLDKNNDSIPSPSKRKKEMQVEKEHIDKKSKKKPDKESPSKEVSSSPEKSSKNGPKEKRKPKIDVTEETPLSLSDEEMVAFKELKNSTKDRNYMRRNREKSDSPEKVSAPLLPEINKEENPTAKETEAPTLSEPEVMMDVDLRVLPSSVVTEAAGITKKRPSADTSEAKPNKKNKLEKFDILFGNEDVDLRQLPQIEKSIDLRQPQNVEGKAVTEETTEAVPSENHKSPTDESPMSPSAADRGPEKEKWSEVKDSKTGESRKIPSQLDLVRAKLAEATKGKDRLGRPLLYNKDDPNGRRRTISSEDTDMRYPKEPSLDSDQEQMKLLMAEAEKLGKIKPGELNSEHYNLLAMKIFEMNERRKLMEAKQRESLEASKRKLQKLSSMKFNSVLSDEEESQSPKQDNVTSFGDIDERIAPSARSNDHFISENDVMPGAMDSDLRVPPIGGPYPSQRGILPMQPRPYANHQHQWNGPRPRGEDFMGPRSRGDDFMGPRPRSDDFMGPRPRGNDFDMGSRPHNMRMRGPFFRTMRPNNRPTFDNRPAFEPRMPRTMPPNSAPLIGTCQGECPLRPYVRSSSPPPLGTTDRSIPPTDIRILDYVEKDPMKTIDIDGVPREIRFYGRTAVVMLEWDDPREINFLPGSRRITFDAKDAVILNFQVDDVNVNVAGELLKIGYGRPTRELYIDDHWYECFFGGPPIRVVVHDKVKYIHMEGPPPQVDISKEKRTDLVIGRINLIVDATSMFPIFLDAKPQVFEVAGQKITIRFVDSLETVLINEKPFRVEFGGLPKPITINRTRHFIRFSVLPRNVRPGHVSIVNMAGKQPPKLNDLQLPADPVEMEQEVIPSQENSENIEGNAGGLDMLASLMPSSMAPASQSVGYSLAEPINSPKTGQIPGLDTPVNENPPAMPAGLPFFGSINVNDLFAKLVATGIVSSSEKKDQKEEKKDEKVEEKTEKKIEEKSDKTAVKRVDFMKPETLRVKQPGVVARLYGGMQCSGCGARFPPEQTVRYSQHLDWHFRQNKRERESARRAHSRNWHYDLSDWIQYEEIEDLEEREKSWFESQSATAEATESPEVNAAEQDALSVPVTTAPQDQHCALCGDKFDQFYNQDREEWHLRRAVRHEDNNYHPLCFEDYKASLNKPEVPIDDSVIEVPMDTEKKEDVSADTIKLVSDEIQHVDLDEDAESDGGSVVEVLESESHSQDAGERLQELKDLEEEDGDEDDVVLKQEPLVQVEVPDDEDTDDETTAERADRDRAYQLAKIAAVKIKQEPIDPDDEPVITAEEEAMQAQGDTTHAAVLSSIDGNVQLETTQAGPALPAGGIRINIAKPPPSAVAPTSPPSSDNNMLEDVSDEPLPPGEETEMEYILKPHLEGVTFSRQPPVMKGTELSGLCSIM